MNDGQIDLRAVVASMHVHVRLAEQGLAPDSLGLSALVNILPALTPFGGNVYAGVKIVLDWDHARPSEFAIVRIYCHYSQHEVRLFETQLRARAHAIHADNLFPEFDLPDYGELPASETYVGVLKPARVEADSTIDELRFASSWRREVRPTVARGVVAAVRQLESYQQAYKQRQSDTLGSAVVIGWAPPCLSRSDAWAVEVWLVTEFDGQTGKAMVFMVDSVTLVTTREYITDVHVA